MSDSTRDDVCSIEAVRVADHERLATLPRHFGRDMVSVEALVFTFTRRMVQGYTGGYWDFYNLTNGGFFMAPQILPAELYVEGNGFRGVMQPDSIGMTVCLFTYSHASFSASTDLLARHYYRLREFALSQPEAHLIAAAID